MVDGGHVLAGEACGLLPLRLSRIKRGRLQPHAVLEQRRAARVGALVAAESLLPRLGEARARLGRPLHALRAANPLRDAPAVLPHAAAVLPRAYLLGEHLPQRLDGAVRVELAHRVVLAEAHAARRGKLHGRAVAVGVLHAVGARLDAVLGEHVVHPCGWDARDAPAARAVGVGCDVPQRPAVQQVVGDGAQRQVVRRHVRGRARQQAEGRALGHAPAVVVAHAVVDLERQAAHVVGEEAHHGAQRGLLAVQALDAVAEHARGRDVAVLHDHAAAAPRPQLVQDAHGTPFRHQRSISPPSS